MPPHHSTVPATAPISVIVHTVSLLYLLTGQKLQTLALDSYLPSIVEWISRATAAPVRHYDLFLLAEAVQLLHADLTKARGASISLLLSAPLIRALQRLLAFPASRLVQEQAAAFFSELFSSSLSVPLPLQLTLAVSQTMMSRLFSKSEDGIEQLYMAVSLLKLIFVRSHDNGTESHIRDVVEEEGGESGLLAILRFTRPPYQIDLCRLYAMTIVAQVQYECRSSLPSFRGSSSHLPELRMR
jgi:hypothetical protein